MAKIDTYRSEKPLFNMNPVKFTLWLFLITVTMLFVAFTSAMVVSRADALQKGTWLPFHIPVAFTISTVIVILGSGTMQWAYYSARKNEIDQNRIALWLSLILGIGFLISQFMGYQALVGEGVFLAGNNDASSYFYIISGIHALHLLGGVFFILATLLSAYQYRVHSKNLLRINMCATYWHFIGGLWVYLFILLSILS